MKQNRINGLAGLFWSAMCLSLTGCAGSGSGTTPAVDSATEVEASPLGSAIAGISGSDLTLFLEGQDSFKKVEGIDDGLGPVFNGTSCGSCHSAGATGGAASNLTEAVVRRIGAIQDGHYTDLESVGGPVLQARSIHEFDASIDVKPEVVPPEAQFVSSRQTTPLFGLGLIESIPESTILAGTSARGIADGIQGVPNMVTNPITGRTELGRFGWKAQISDLLVFSGDAYLNEMGITNTVFMQENLPQGQAIPSGVDVNDPDDADGDLPKFATFMRLLAPPTRSTTMTAAIARGEKFFDQVGCVNCHRPSMSTGTVATPALSNKVVRLYSDLLLHKMGGELADGIQQGDAKGDQFRTAPLWGISSRSFLLHDGRATTVGEAVSMHGGEATATRNRYEQLSRQSRQDLEAFVKSL